MFVELKMKRGMELFSILGILRVAPSAGGSRLTLFGVAQPVESEESYASVAEKLAGAEGPLAAEVTGD